MRLVLAEGERMSMASIRKKFGLTVKVGQHIKIINGTYAREVGVILGASKDLHDHLVVRDCSGRNRPRWRIRVHPSDLQELKGVD